MINTSNPGENLCGLKKADFQKVIDGKQTDLFISRRSCAEGKDDDCFLSQ